MTLRLMIVASCCASLAGCALLPERVDYHDKRLMPMLEAMAAVNRDSLGFTPISERADIKLELSSIFHHSYDAMLHIYDKTSRTIAFKKIEGKYLWIGEQEIHTGPRRYTTVDGTFNEEITITYETEHISGAPLYQISIIYQGPDSHLSSLRQLQLNDVRSLVAAWDAIPARGR